MKYKHIHDDYTGYITSIKDKESTIDRRKNDVQRYLDWCEDTNTDPVDVDSQDMDAYIRSILDYSPNSTATLLSSVSMLYDWMANNRDYALDTDPTAEISLEEDYEVKTNIPLYVTKLLKDGNDADDEDRIIKALPKARVEQILEHPGQPELRNFLAISLLWQTAMRADELARVRIDNINRDRREIRIRSSKLNPDDHPELYRRRVYYQPSLDKWLDMWLNEARPAYSKYASDSPYLLLTDQNEQMRPSHISRIVKRAAKRAGVQEPMYTDSAGKTRWLVTAHRIRHSTISYWANHTDLDINHIRRLAGHAKLETTLDYISTSWKETREEYHASMRRAEQ